MDKDARLGLAILAGVLAFIGLTLAIWTGPYTFASKALLEAVLLGVVAVFASP